MNNQIPEVCESCGAPVKFIPAGISRKTGKKYNEFYSCSDRCGWTWRPDRGQSLSTKNRVEKESPSEADNEKILIGLREIYKEVKELRLEFQEFTRIFGEQNKEE